MAERAATALEDRSETTTADGGAAGKRDDSAPNRPVDPLALRLEAARHRVGLHALPRIVAGALRLTWEASHRGFLLAAGLQIVGALSAVALVVVGQLALDVLLALDRVPPGPATVAAVVAALAVVTAIGSANATLQQQQQRLLGEQVSLVTWRRLLDVTGRVPLDCFESPGFYDQLQRIQTNALIRPVTVTTGAFGLLGGAAGIGGLLAVLLTIDPLLVPALLLAGVPALLLSRRSSAREFAFAAEVSPTYRARDYLRRVLTGRDEAKEVRAFGTERTLRARHDTHSAGYVTALRRHVRVRQAYALGGVAATATALAASLALLVWFLSIGRISLAEAGAAVLGIRMLSGRLDQSFQAIGGLVESSIFLDDLDRFLGLATVTERPGTGDAPTLRRAVVAEGVSYTYPGADRPALRDVDVTIGAGEIIAVVGENGSGKTTLAKLLAGLHAPTSGTIRWDGVDTAELEPADVRRGVSVIFQDFVRYRLSALENIGLGDPDHHDDGEAARAAAYRAGAAAYLERLPRGYETILSKEYAGGTELSLGQWQRVALARALRRDAPLVILDEPSSALDPRAEQALFADVRATLEGRAAVLVSHRYSTVRTADRIYVMREGRIVESGSHDALMAQGGLYAELFTLQARAYR